MSVNVNYNNLGDFESMIYKRKLMIPKDKLPQRYWEENYNSDENFGIVAMNRDGNKAEIQEMAKLLSQIIYKIRHLIDIKIPNICKLFSHLKHSSDG